jgi:hypothetical protein
MGRTWGVHQAFARRKKKNLKSLYNTILYYSGDIIMYHGNLANFSDILRFFFIVSDPHKLESGSQRKKLTTKNQGHHHFI